MAKKTREKIQDSAVRLFNERGYQQVSLRDIAKEADTTIGNLTYHFPQKENLLISILDNLHMEFPIKISGEIHRAELLSHLLNSFVSIQKNEEKQPFYYRNINELTMDSPYIHEESEIFQVQLYEYYESVFQTLREDGVFRPDIPSEVLQSLAYSIVTLSAVWIQNNTPYNNRKLPDYPIAYTLSNLIRAYITFDYQSEFDKQCREKQIIP